LETDNNTTGVLEELALALNSFTDRKYVALFSESHQERMISYQISKNM